MNKWLRLTIITSTKTWTSIITSENRQSIRSIKHRPRIGMSSSHRPLNTRRPILCGKRLSPTEAVHKQVVVCTLEVSRNSHTSTPASLWPVVVTAIRPHGFTLGIRATNTDLTLRLPHNHHRYQTRLIHPYATCLRVRDWIGRPTSMARRGTACTPITNTRARRFCTAMSISRRNNSLNHLRCSATNGRPTNSHSSTTLAVPKGIA